ncbi:MAG: hypothetical protein J1F13_04475 [Prevotellaceae bacterium]|nr:hypothetical protein [Prevotellaceae bacterium]
MMMKELELFLIDKGENCTMYTLQFLHDTENEFEKFVTKFVNNEDYSEDYTRIAAIIKRIYLTGALERYFRLEGKLSDSVVALPVLASKLRLYCLRLSDKILILGNGGVKKTQTYNEDNELKGYVMTLQRFEELLKRGVEEGEVVITETDIETDKIFTL